MEGLKNKLAKTDWQSVAESMHTKGYAIVEKVFLDNQCEKLINDFDSENAYRKTVIMERYRFGLGVYKYFSYPLPKIVGTIRKEVYPHLVPIANLWMKMLKTDILFPDRFDEFRALCHQNNQIEPTPLLLKYQKGGFNTLHQDIYGDVFFPIQTVIFLNEPDKDFTGGEFVMTQQSPRAQSKAIVLRPRKGDMLIFTTRFRPVKGTKGYYRENIKHGVSEVLSGERHTLGVIYHDAIS